MQKNNKGFTLIELLIAIAIVAILAGVVLLNIIGFIGKGKDTAAKGNMDTLLINITSYYSINKDFTGLSNDDGYIRVKNALAKDGYTLAEALDDAKSNWCGCIQLKEDTTKFYCVDATGVKEKTTSACSMACSAGVCCKLDSDGACK